MGKLLQTMFLHYFINNRLRWGKGGGDAGKCREAESKKYIFHSKGRFFKFNLIEADF